MSHRVHVAGHWTTFEYVLLFHHVGLRIVMLVIRIGDESLYSLTLHYFKVLF